MSAKIMSSLTDENKDLRKQIGCMNGIFQLFDRHHFLTGRRTSSRSHKRLIQGGQHQQDPQCARKTVTEKDVEVQKEKPRISMESSRASNSSSCSSTFSSLDCNRTAQPETLPLRQVNIPESPYQITAMKEKQAPLTKGMQSLDLRDVVKDSMYREARSLSIKSQANDERRGHAIKHIDSPRPLQQSKSAKPKATGYEGSTRVLAKVQEGTKNSKDEWVTLPRYSYDGRESRETFKSAMKQKELPRLSLDSRASSMQSSALKLRLNFLGRDIENENSSEVLQFNQEPGSHGRSSSVVAKLMGLGAFPDTISTDERPTPTIKSCPKEAFLSQPTIKAEESKQNQVASSPRVSQSNPASPSPRLHSANSVRKPTSCSRFPMEPAQLRQQDASQGSPKTASQSRKAATNTQHLSSSVYGEIEKRITELEFKKSGKDLRALKQILDAMQKTREQLGDQRGEFAEFTSERRCSWEDSCSDQNSNLSMWKNRKSYHQVPSIQGPCPPKQLGCSAVTMKPVKVTDKVKVSISPRVTTTEKHLQRLQIRDPKNHRGNSAHRKKAKDLTPKNNNVKDPSRHLPSTDKKTTWRNSELDRNLTGTQCIQVQNCTASGRSFGVVSPRLQKNILRMEGQSHPTTPSSDSGRVKKHSSKKLIEKGSQNRKHQVKSKNLQLSDDQMSELSSETRYSSYQGDTASVKSESNNSIVSQIETEVTSLAHSVNTSARPKENSVSTMREHIPAVEIAITMLEQPSPVSVLDDTFYSEDSPSPVKKISTAFQDESPSPDEAEWHLENLNLLTDCRRYDHGYKYNQKLENMNHSIHQLRFLKAGPHETAANHNALACESLNPHHRYINKILLTSGLLKDSSFISTTDQLLSSCYLINPDMFHVLEQTEDIIWGANGELIEKNDRLKSNKKIHRKIIFDMVNEILVRKITSGSLFTVGKKRVSPQELLKEVYLEMDRVSRTSDCNLDAEDNEMIRLLGADMIYPSEDWADYRGEVPAMVLDIERLIFKDLINEVVTGELMGFHDWPQRHCRQLFSK